MLSLYHKLCAKKNADYDRLADGESDHGLDKLEAAQYASSRTQNTSASKYECQRFLTGLAVGLCIAALALLVVWYKLDSVGIGSFETGFGNELGFALGAIKVSQMRFTGGIKIHDNGTMYRDDGIGLTYVGKPDPSIDANWDALIGTRYLAFTGQQKTSIPVDMYEDPKTGLSRAGPDVFHSLHCVNKLRMTVEGYMYDIPEKIDESPNNVLHIEHCLDFLRQLVQCTSDLTPIPLVYNKGAGIAIPDFEQVHTCRQYDSIRSWATNQNHEAEASARQQESTR